MLFSDDQNKDAQSQKKRSTLGFLFNPEIGKDLKPLGESFGMFPRIIAMIFAMQGLFPKDHPALNDLAMRLTLRDVIGGAYSRLRFTRDGLPQIVLFAAVVGMLAVSALIVVTLFASLFVGNAHAQSMFQTPATNDFADNWIDYLFYGKDLTMNTGTGSSVSTSCTVQPTLSKALGFYSNALLVLAGIILIYHLTVMIAETAHKGTPMGRANQIWAPIRLVVAIGLLVPVSTTGGGSCPVSGYNVGQYLAISVARMGSGLASNVWKMFVTNLGGAAGSGCASGSTSSNCSVNVADVTALVSTLMTYDACAKITNDYLNQSSLGSGVAEIQNLDGVFSSNTEPGRKYHFGYGVLDSVALGATGGISRYLLGNGLTVAEAEKICGGYEVPRSAGENSIYAPLARTQLDAFDKLRGEINKFNQKYLPLVNAEAENEALAKAARDEFAKLVDNFKNELNTNISSAMTSVRSQEKEQQNTYLNGSDFSETGWLMAGAWFNTISRMQAQQSNALHHALPEPISPLAALFEDSSAEDDTTRLNGVQEATKRDLKKYTSMLKIFKDHFGAMYSSDVSERNKSLAMIGTNKPDTNVIKEIFKALNPVELLLQLVDKTAWAIGLWDADGTLGVRFGGSGNPLYEITAFGQKNITYGSTLLGLGGTIALAGGAGIQFIVEYNLAPIAEFLAGILIFASSIFFTIGFTMAFVVPLYPFYRFFFGALQWLVLVVEAVVSAPLFALAHLSPYGEGLPGQKANYGYSVGAQMLLRPVLMIFGLAAGFLLFNAALSFLNFAFEIAARGTGAYGGNALISKVLYSVLYCVLVLIMANQCFKTIGVFPQIALQYLGLQNVKEERFDPGYLTTATTYLSSQFLGGHLKNAALGPGNMAKGLVANKKKDDDEDALKKRLAHERNYRDSTSASLGQIAGALTAGGVGGLAGGGAGGLAGGGGNPPSQPPMPPVPEANEEQEKADKFMEAYPGYTGPKDNSPGSSPSSSNNNNSNNSGGGKTS